MSSIRGIRVKRNLDRLFCLGLGAVALISFGHCEYRIYRYNQYLQKVDQAGGNLVMQLDARIKELEAQRERDVGWKQEMFARLGKTNNESH